MSIRMLRTPVVAFLAWSMTTGSSSLAQALLHPPACLSNVRQTPLNAARASLVKQGDVLKEKVNNHNAKCRSVEAGTPLDAECAAEQERLDAELKSFSTQKKTFNASVIQAVQDQLKEAEERAARSRRELEAQTERFEGFRKGIDEWNALSDKGHEELQATLAEVSTALFLEGLSQRAEAKVELKEEELKSIERLLRSRTLMNDQYDKARALRHIEKLRTWQDVYAVLSIIQESFATAHAAKEVWNGDWAALGPAMLGVIEIANQSTSRLPYVTLLINDGKIVIADIYAAGADYAARKRVAQLVDCEEIQLKGLRIVSDLYKKDVLSAKCLRDYLKIPN